MGSPQDNFKFFTDNHDEIFKLYPDMFVVIKDMKVVFAEKSFEDALKKAIAENFIVGSFLIQECTQGDEGYTQTFHSRAIF